MTWIGSQYDATTSTIGGWRNGVIQSADDIPLSARPAIAIGTPNARLSVAADQNNPGSYLVTGEILPPSQVPIATLKAQLAKVPAPLFVKLQTAAIAWAYTQNDPNAHDRADRAATDSKAAVTLVAQWLQTVPNGAISLGVPISGVV